MTDPDAQVASAESATSTEAGGLPPPRKAKRDFTTAQQLSAVAGALIAALMLGLTFYVQVLRRPDPAPTTPSAPASSIAIVTSGVSGTTTAPTMPPVGTCLRGAAQVPCDGPHDGEVVASLGNCTGPALVSYLGGSAVDVLRPDLTLNASPTLGCTVTAPSDLVASQRGALANSGGAELRWCLADNGSRVSCARSHAAEIVYQRPTGSTELLACVNRAEAYVDSSWPQLSETLKVTEEILNGRDSCVIRPLGDNRLTASLRGLRRNQPPVSGRT